MRLVLPVLTLFFIGSVFAGREIPGLEIKEIHKNVYLHKSFSRADGFGLASSNGLVVVDSGKAFEDPEYLLAGGLIEVFYPGRGHTIDNIVVWLPESEILFGGCFVRSLGTDGLGYVGEAHIDQWFNSVEKVLLKYPQAKIVVPGHGNAGDIQLLQHTIKLAESAYNASVQPTAKALPKR